MSKPDPDWELRNQIGQWMLKRGIKMGVKVDPGYVQDLLEDWEHEQRKAWHEAANKLFSYCEDHEWGTMPEPFDSINPLLRLLNGVPKGAKRS